MCLKLLTAKGSPCRGRACEKLGACASRSCSTHWLRPAALFEQLVAHHRWLLFVGDSDTRLLACTLLQMLAEAGHGRGAVQNNSRLWMGQDKRLPLRKWDVEVVKRREHLNSTRVCHLDWRYGYNGRVLTTRAIPCLAELGHTLGGNASGGAYAELGADYSLDAQSTQAGNALALRVTFISVTGPTSFVQTMRHLQEQFEAPRAQRPSLLYLNSGLWPEQQPRAHLTTREVLQRLTELGSVLTAGSSASPRPNVQLVWGTVVGHRIITQPHVSEDWRTSGTAFDRELAPALLAHGSQRWTLLNRNTNLSRLGGTAGMRGIRLSDRHQPPLVNYIDLQRCLRPCSRHVTRRVRRAKLHHSKTGWWPPSLPRVLGLAKPFQTHDSCQRTITSALSI